MKAGVKEREQIKNKTRLPNCLRLRRRPERYCMPQICESALRCQRNKPAAAAVLAVTKVLVLLPMQSWREKARVLNGRITKQPLFPLCIAASSGRDSYRRQRLHFSPRRKKQKQKQNVCISWRESSSSWRPRSKPVRAEQARQRSGFLQRHVQFGSRGQHTFFFFKSIHPSFYLSSVYWTVFHCRICM